MKAKDIMTAAPCCCSPDDSIQQVASTMRDNDCGAIPIVDDGCVVGIVTDRDLAMRALAEGLGTQTRVGTLITRNPTCARANDDIRVVEKLMADNQVRRIPIVDAEGCCIGIVSQGDLARAALQGKNITDHEIAIVAERISEPYRLAFDRDLPGGELEQQF